MNEETITKEHQKNLRQKTQIGLLLILLLVIAFLVSIKFGATEVSLKQIMDVFLGKEKGYVWDIVINVRLPQVITALFAGSALSVAGAVMQNALKNPLASPYTLGISQAAAFGAAFSIVVIGVDQSTSFLLLEGTYIISLLAFFFAISSAFLMIFLAKMGGISSESMVLAGIALGSLFTAGYTALQYLASEVELSSIVFWTFGDVGRTTYGEIVVLAFFVLIGLFYFTYKSWSLDIIVSGDEVAKSLGIDVDKLRVIAMVGASLVTAITVSFVGIIGFVGLVVPHIVRKLMNGTNIYLIPYSALFGASLLMISDTVSRTLFTPQALPVGILTSFLGAPLFIYLITRGERNW